LSPTPATSRMLEHVRMSSPAAATTVRRLPRPSSTPPSDPLAFRLLAWGTTGIVVAGLAWGSVRSFGTISNVAWELGAWVALVAIVDLAPIPKRTGLRLEMDLPLLLGAAYVFGPLLGALVAFIGAFDMREFTRQMPLSHALFNRSQTALSVAGAGLVFSVSGVSLGDVPLAFLPSLGGLLADAIINYLLVSAAASLLSGLAWRQVISRMRFGRPQEFAVTYLCFGGLGLLLALIHSYIGPWGLAAFVIPVVLARQAFHHARLAEEQALLLMSRERVLERLSRRIQNERRDERHRIASSLHDDVLQALYNVTLHAQVVREDLRSGRLLQLEDDVPGLLTASDRAGSALRDVIRGLRKSSLGQAGLEDTLRLLVEHLRGQTDVRLEAAIEQVDACPSTQLAAYQIAKEALTNAVHHARAEHVAIKLTRCEDSLEIEVEDDGQGFVLDLVDGDRHFGVALMHERARMANGTLAIDSKLGRGTAVRARLPRNEPAS
jgi:signal transduction histidine kinase